MNPSIATVIPLVALIGYVAIVILIARQRLRRRASWLFLWYILWLMLWALGSFMLHANFGVVDPLMASRLLIVGGLFASVAFFHFVRVFLMKSEHLLWLLAAYGLCVMFAVLTALGYSVTGEVVNGSWQYRFGPAGYFIGVVSYAFMIAAAIQLLQEFRRTKDSFVRNRIAYPLAGATLILVLGLTNFLPTLGRYPIDQAGNLVNAALLSYAVLRYRLMDVTLVLRRGFIYSTLTVLIVAIFLLLAVVLQYAFHGYMAYGFWASAVIVAMIVAVMFQPVHRLAQRWIDRLFYRESYEYRRTLRTSTQKLSTILNLNELAEWLVDNLTVTMRASKGALFLLDRETERYILRQLKGYDNPVVRGIQLRGDNPVVRHLARGDSCLTAEDLDRLPQLRSLWRLERGQLRELETALLVPLKAKDSLIGVLVLGPKLSEQPYSADDLELLFTVASQAAIAVENARLYEEATGSAERMAVLNELAKIAGSSLNVNEVFRAFADGVKKLVDFDQISVNLVDELGQRVEVLALSEETPGKATRGDIIPLKGSGTEWVVRQGKASIESEIEREHRFASDDLLIAQGFRSTIRLPLIAKGRVFGSFNLRSRHPYAYGESELRILEQVAAQLAVTIENARLYEEMRQAYEELKAAQDYMVQSERLRALGEMAGGVAHDFNNILAVILGRAQLALDDAKEPRLRKSLQVIERTALDAAKTVRRLQEFTRVRVDREFEVVNLNQVVRSALQMVEPRRAERHETGDVEIEISADLDRVPPVEGNPAELKEALMNILFNAMDAMPQGGKITVKSEQEDSWVILSISDTGVGMSEEIKAKIFDPFFTTKGRDGLGLGLSVTYGIVTRHGGRIEVDSKLGEGSTFCLRLPVATSSRRRARAASSVSTLARSLKILLVDDDPQVSEVLALMLNQLGNQVTVATRGKEALAFFEKGEYQLVITDLGMPDMSGREVARAIKEMKPKTPVVLITGWGVQLDPQKMREIGVDGVIAKPFTKDALSAQIAGLVDNSLLR